MGLEIKEFNESDDILVPGISKWEEELLYFFLTQLREGSSQIQVLNILNFQSKPSQLGKLSVPCLLPQEQGKISFYESTENYLLHLLNGLSCFAIGLPEYWMNWFMWKQHFRTTVVSWRFLQNLSKAFLVHSLLQWALSFCLVRLQDSWSYFWFVFENSFNVPHSFIFHPLFRLYPSCVYAVYSGANDRTSPLEPLVLPVPPSSLCRAELSSIHILDASAFSENRNCYCSTAFTITFNSISHPAWVFLSVQLCSTTWSSVTLQSLHKLFFLQFST